MKNIDSKSHVRGESIYLDDIPLVEGTLFACVFDSPVAHGKLNWIRTAEAEMSEGVVRVITAKDIIGENQIGHTPMGSELTIATGDAFDIFVQAEVEKREKITSADFNFDKLLQEIATSCARA